MHTRRLNVPGSILITMILGGLIFLAAGRQVALAETSADTSQCPCACAAVTSEQDPSPVGNNESPADTAPPDNAQDANYNASPAAAVPETAFASVKFSELFPDPVGSDAAGEFIELRSLSTSDIDLAGWKIARQGDDARALPAVRIGAGAYYALVYLETKLPLVNTGMTLILLDPAGQEADSVSYSAPVKEGQTYAKNESGLWVWTKVPTPGSANQFPVEISAAPESTSPAPAVSDSNEVVDAPAVQILTAETPAAPAEGSAAPQTATEQNEQARAIMINEFLPDPLGDDAGEWIELFNAGPSVFSLAGWSLDDAEGGSRPYAFADTDAIPPNGYLVLTKTLDKLALNNDADSVRLIDPAGRAVDAISYIEPPEGRSFARFSDGWRWSSLPSPGQANAESAPDNGSATAAQETASDQAAEPPAGAASPPTDVDAAETVISASLEELPELEEGDLIRTEGIVSLPPGAVAKTIMAIQNEDATAGVLVRLSGAERPALKVGQRISLLGRLRANVGETSVSTRARDLALLPGGVLGRSELSLAEVAEAVSGQSISVSGSITGAGKTWLKMADDAGEHEIKVLLPDNNRSAAKVGDRARISAVVRRRNSAAELIVLDRSGLVLAEAPAPSVTEETAPAPSSLAPPRPTPVHLTVSASRVPYAAYGLAAAAVGAAAIALAVWRKRQTTALQE